MSETLINIGTALVLLAVIVTFARKRLSYLGRALAPCAVFVLEFLTWLAWGARLALHWFGYRVLLGRREPPVKRFGVQAGVVGDDYVESGEQDAPSSAVSPQTDRLPDQTDSAPALDVTKPSREELLTMYQVLRAHNMSRETARKMLNGVRLPLDNNLWAEAAPKPVAPDDEEIVTPYAGRRTKAAYYPEEPELEYQAP